MRCKHCGRNNPLNVKRCIYCGAPFIEDDIRNKNRDIKQRQTESVIVVSIIILILVLVIIAGTYIYNGNIPHKSGFSGGGGGGTTSPSISVVAPEPPGADNNVPNGGDNAQDSVVEVVIPTAVPTLTPRTTPSPTPDQVPIYDERIARKESFLDKADEIKVYAEKYLDVNKSQSEINIESSNVYEMWDALLNEVYQYLKTILPSAEFERLKDDELEWIAEKEKAIEEAGAAWEGGSGEPMARNLTAIRYTQERCYYLISLID